MTLSLSIFANATETEGADTGPHHVCTEAHDHSTIIFTEVTAPEALISITATCPPHTSNAVCTSSVIAYQEVIQIF